MAIKQVVKRMLGPRLQYLLTAQKIPSLVLKSFGQLERECSICGYHGRFLALIHFPDVYHFDAKCPKCASIPRTRLLWSVIQQERLVGDNDELLHFAPEKVLMPYLRKLPASYVTADLMSPVADLKLNIEKIDLPDHSFDVIVCSHVLEHVNDRLAMSELFRILKPGGRLLAMVPIAEGWETTYENPRELSLDERRFHYGRTDHVRRYGRDFTDRLEAAGFGVDRVTLDGPQTIRYGLIPGESVFVCTRPA